MLLLLALPTTVRTMNYLGTYSDGGVDVQLETSDGSAQKLQLLQFHINMKRSPISTGDSFHLCTDIELRSQINQCVSLWFFWFDPHCAFVIEGLEKAPTSARTLLFLLKTYRERVNSFQVDAWKFFLSKRSEFVDYGFYDHLTELMNGDISC